MKVNSTHQRKEDGITQVYNAEGCRYQLRQDLATARGRIIIVSPYATVNAISEWQKYLVAAVEKGIIVCVFIREPRMWKEYLANRTNAEDTAQMQRFEAAIQFLQRIGCHVTLRTDIHEKLIIIDDHILWEGSKNVLSWFETSERTRRWNDEDEVAAAILEHNLLACNICKDKPSIAKQLTILRQHQCLSKLELASQISTTSKTIWEFETERTESHMKRVYQICEAVDADLIAVPKHLSKRVHNLVESTLKAKAERNGDSQASK